MHKSNPEQTKTGENDCPAADQLCIVAEAFMKRARIVLMALFWAMSPAWGQTVQPTNAPAPAVASPSESVPAVAQPLIPNRPIIIPSVIPPGPPNAPDRPQRPAVPEHQTPGASVQELIRNFQ